MFGWYALHTQIHTLSLTLSPSVCLNIRNMEGLIEAYVLSIHDWCKNYSSSMDGMDCARFLVFFVVAQNALWTLFRNIHTRRMYKIIIPFIFRYVVWNWFAGLQRGRERERVWGLWWTNEKMRWRARKRSDRRWRWCFSCTFVVAPQTVLKLYNALAIRSALNCNNFLRICSLLTHKHFILTHFLVPFWISLSLCRSHFLSVSISLSLSHARYVDTFFWCNQIFTSKSWTWVFDVSP